MNPGFEDRIMVSPAVREWVGKLTEDVRDTAEELAPFLTGHLESAIEAVVEFDGSRGRWVGRVVSKDFKTIWNEFGTKHSRAKPFLRTALTRRLPGARTISR